MLTSGGCGGRGTTATYCTCSCHTVVGGQLPPCDERSCGARGSKPVKLIAAVPVTVKIVSRTRG